MIKILQIISAIFLLTSPLLADSVTLDSTDIIDTWIRSSAPTTNFGSDQFMFIDSLASGYTRFMIMAIDLSGIPAGATIDSAQLDMTTAHTGHVGDSLEVYSLLTAFVELEATFNIPSTGNNWGGGGSFTIASDVSLAKTEQAEDTMTSANYEHILMSSSDGDGLVEIIQDILDGNAEGFIFNMTGASDPNMAWCTVQNSDTSRRPILYIEYTEAGGDISHVRRIIYLK